jgi:hypothetical protein
LSIREFKHIPITAIELIDQPDIIVDEENEYITPVDVGTDADDKPSDKPDTDTETDPPESSSVANIVYMIKTRA